MSDISHLADELADLMDEFKLGSAELTGDGWRVAFSRKAKMTQTGVPMMIGAAAAPEEAFEEPAEAAPEVPAGLPVSSPMAGVFYHASSPNASPFCKEGDIVSHGQVVGLIEAMKVFNEITAPTAGRVVRLVASNGQVVGAGEPLLFIG